MKRIIFCTIIGAITIINTGCLTHSVLESNKKRIAIRKAIASNNEAAIQAIKDGKDIDAVGIHITTSEAIFERPVLLGGAAVGDGLILWGGVEGVRWIADQDSDSSDNTSSDSSTRGDSTTINVEGNDNNFNINQGNTVEER